MRVSIDSYGRHESWGGELSSSGAHVSSGSATHAEDETGAEDEKEFGAPTLARALNGYRARSVNELTLREGEPFSCWPDESGWWYAIKPDGSRGYVPCTFVELGMAEEESPESSGEIVRPEASEDDDYELRMALALSLSVEDSTATPQQRAASPPPPYTRWSDEGDRATSPHNAPQSVSHSAATDEREPLYTSSILSREREREKERKRLRPGRPPSRAIARSVPATTLSLSIAVPERDETAPPPSSRQLDSPSSETRSATRATPSAPPIELLAPPIELLAPLDVLSCESPRKLDKTRAALKSARRGMRSLLGVHKHDKGGKRSFDRSRSPPPPPSSASSSSRLAAELEQLRARNCALEADRRTAETERARLEQALARDGQGQGTVRGTVRGTVLFEESDRRGTSGAECLVCLDRTPELALVPCGHTLCRQCADLISMKALRDAGQCPTCQRRVESTFRIFI